MTKPAAKEGCTAHLPEQPRQAFGALGAFRGKKGSELLGQIKQDSTGFKHPDRRRSAAVEQGRDLGVRVDRDEAAAELVAVADPDQPGVVLCSRVPRFQKLFQHDRDLDAVRRAKRIKL